MFKRFAYRVLCNEVTGSIILYLFGKKIPDIRWNGFRYNVSDTGMSKTIIAAIFWGFYESSEIRFVEKYFTGNVDTVELGVSSGILSSHIVSILKPGRQWIGVEANHQLKINCLENISRYNRNSIAINLLNAAVYYDAENVQFEFGDDPTESRLAINTDFSASITMVPTTTLKKIVDEFKLNEYALFCDIEGSEAAIFVNENTVLKNCMYLFIELHYTDYRSTFYSPKDLEEMILAKGFRLVDSHGPVFYFNRMLS